MHVCIGHADVSNTHTAQHHQWAVHACARCTHDPKRSHGNAIEKICQHLEGTKKCGIKVRHTPLDPSNLQVNCHVATSFAPVWTQCNNNNNAKSQMRHSIQIDNVPVSWCLRKQELTALSPTEVELIALLTAVRELSWVRRCTSDVAKGFGIEHSNSTIVHSKVFEQQLNVRCDV